MRSRSNRSRIPAHDLRAGLAARFVAPAPRKRQQATVRERRGLLSTEDAVWRRCEMGTNTIACFGVWRRGMRRQAERQNRAGTTRWRMPHQGGARIVLPGVRHEVVNQD